MRDPSGWESVDDDGEGQGDVVALFPRSPSQRGGDDESTPILALKSVPGGLNLTQARRVSGDDLANGGLPNQVPDLYEDECPYASHADLSGPPDIILNEDSSA